MNTICYFASLVVAFFTRKVLLDNLGTEFVGLTGTLGSLLGFLNVAELGVGTAIGYVLYKPLFDDDKSKINEIVSVLGYLYHCIGLFIVVAGLLVSLILPWIISNTTISLGVIYFGFYAFLGSSVLAYFANYRMVLLSADQRNYVITGYYQFTTSVKVIVQMLLAIYVCSFYLYFAIEFTLSILNALILQRKIKKTYPWLQTNIKQGRFILRNYPEIITYIKQVFVHKIAGFVQYQLTPILIYAYASLSMVAIYSNYTIVVLRVQNLVSGIMGSSWAGVGNLISEGDRIKMFSVYKSLLSINIFLGSLIAICVFVLITPFVHLWLGKEYELSTIVVLLISIQLFLQTVRGVNDQFINGFGLFYDIWAPLTESAIFILSSIALGAYYGLPGVLSGPLISTLFIGYGWKPTFLFKEGFFLSPLLFFQLLGQGLSAIAISLILTFCIYSHKTIWLPDNSEWLQWIIQSFLFVGTLSVITFLSFVVLISDFRIICIQLFSKFTNHG